MKGHDCISTSLFTVRLFSVFQDSIVSLQALSLYACLLLCFSTRSCLYKRFTVRQFTMCFRTRLYLYNPWHCTSGYCVSGLHRISTSLVTVRLFTVVFQHTIVSLQAFHCTHVHDMFQDTIVSLQALSLYACFLCFRTISYLYKPCHCMPVYCSFSAQNRVSTSVLVYACSPYVSGHDCVTTNPVTVRLFSLLQDKFGSLEAFSL